MKKPSLAFRSGIPDEETDGRRRRGNTSRARIVDAMLKLISEGNLQPGAARVAEIAGVSLRTVFRHFDEMETLYKEISEVIQSRVLPVLSRPYRAEAWRERVLELVDRRIELYETILPFRLAGDLRRHQSEYISNDYAQHLKLERMSMETLLPREIAGDDVLLHALLTATSFQGWRILRKDQELAIDGARAVVLRTVDALLASHDGDREPGRAGNKGKGQKR